LTDETVANQLGTSVRTVQRRVHQLSLAAGAKTRMQLGWHAARHGWA
jgi:DNA-binding NarL/FixJ family response regulator